MALLACSTVHDVSAGFAYKPIAAFVRGPESPSSSVVQVGADFYGTTSRGGVSGNGTIFRMTPAGEITTIAHLTDLDGRFPEAGLAVSSTNDLFGTTSEGGLNGHGTIFRVTTAGVLTVLHHFNGANGSKPLAELVLHSSGFFYGTASAGGANSLGVVFRISESGTYSLLASFSAATGKFPQAPLFLATNGNFYGTCYQGGSNDEGNVFRLTPTGDLTQIFSFSGSQGGFPLAGVVQGADGNLYGTTSFGGTSQFGTVFRMPIAGGSINHLVNFDGTNGLAPEAELVRGSDGNFYGTTPAAGASETGNIFRMTPAGAITSLHTFNGTNGRAPGSALFRPASGNVLYGTTKQGGTNDKGTVFSINTSSAFTSLASFNSQGGAAPLAKLMQATDGTFYGTTSEGGSQGAGTIFRLLADGTLNNIANFNGTNGKAPVGHLVQDTAGNFFGTTSAGGANLVGTVFQVTPAGAITTLVSLSNEIGQTPLAGLVRGNDGNFYGTNSFGEDQDFGNVFRISPIGAYSNVSTFDESNGLSPYTGLILGSDGNFYGTTIGGGSGSLGTVFRITTGGAITTLAQFNFTNGSSPFGELFQATDGHFYGTTSAGGADGGGTIFRVTSAGILTTLHNFNALTGGRRPIGGLVQAADGFLYGSTSEGGTNSFGTLYRISLAGSFNHLRDMDFATGAAPQASMIRAADGSLYGVTRDGGQQPNGQRGGAGQIFRILFAADVTTAAATSVSQSSATLNGQVAPGSFSTTVGFQYGTSPTLATFTTAAAGSVAANPGTLPFQASISGLVGNQTYYFRATALSAENPNLQLGQILSFTTPLQLQPSIQISQNSTAIPDNSPSPISLGSIKLGESNSLIFTIANSGNASLNISSIVDSGSHAGDFAVSGPVNNLVATGATTTFTVQFIPTAGGDRNALITISSNAPGDAASYTFQVTGIGITPLDQYLAWAASESLVGPSAAPDAMPFGDAVRNVIKYAFNLDGSTPDVRTLPALGAAGLPRLVGVGTPLRIEYLRRKGSGLLYAVEGSTTLNGFVPLTGSESVTQIDGLWERVLFTETPSVTTVPRFGRVRVTLP